MKVTHDRMVDAGESLDEALQWVHLNHVEDHGRMVRVEPGKGHFGTARHYKAVLFYYNQMLT
jgi:hypothetical protein